MWLCAGLQALCVRSWQAQHAASLPMLLLSFGTGSTGRRVVFGLRGSAGGWVQVMARGCHPAS